MPEMIGDWIYDKTQQLGGQTGGGVCYVACDSKPLSVLAGTLPTIGAAGRNGVMELAGAVFKMNQLRVHPQDMIAVIKFAKSADERFRREIEKLAGLSHPNLVRILDFDREKQVWYVMERHQRGDLTQSATRDEYKGQPRKVLQRALGIADALATLHANSIIHRDIKAKNVLVAEDGRWILTDLGVALDLGDSDRLTIGSQPFSPTWRPDWVVGETDQSTRMDVQMLAKLLHFMISGLPTPAPDSQISRNRFDLRVLFPGLSSVAAHDLIVQNVSTDPELVRCSDGAEFAAEIRRTLNAMDGGPQERLLFSFTAEHSPSWISTTRGQSHALSRILVVLSPQDENIVVRARLEGVEPGVTLKALLHPYDRKTMVTVGGSEELTVSDWSRASSLNWAPGLTIPAKRLAGPHFVEIVVEPLGTDARDPKISGVMITGS